MLNFKMWIDGKWVDAESNKTYGVINPATEEEIARVPLSDQQDVNKAVEAARRAFPAWSGKSQAERSRIINKIAEALGEHVEELARLDVIDHGTPIKLGRMWSSSSVHTLEYAAQASRSLTGDAVNVRPNSLYSILREPIGVCALIIPWNSPILMVTSKMGAALAVGNTCIIKPSAIDSLVTLKFVEILEKLDLPPGVINVVTGPGGSVGEAIAAHPGIDMISFTGSSETGKSIMALSSRNLKRLHMELGGKNPFIILDDADVAKLALQSAGSTCANSGMICASPGRYYLHEKIYDEFIEKFTSAIKKVVVGDPNDENTAMGPVVSAEHRDRVEGYIQSGIREGAELVLGGQRPSTAPLDRGYYILPTIFKGVKPGMKIFREEIFGPVACFIKFSSDEEVIRSANDNAYGLCASIWTRDMGRGLRMAAQIKTGSVGVNTSRFIAPETPWGGIKESGFGKENSLHGFEEYTQLRLLAADYTG